MLEPSHDRLDYTEILRKPAPDFELTAAIACTYSLDLSALLAALLPLGFEGDAANECRNNPVFALHALKKLLPKLAVFCDGASIKVPDLKQNRLLALLDRAVYPVKHKTAFHPKFWLLKFSRQDEVRYRLVVLSKNITFDRSWDMALTLDGVPSAENANGAPLSFMLQMFYKSQWGKSKRLNILAGLMGEIRQVSFFNDDIKPEDLLFIPFGTDMPVRDEFLLNDKATFHRLLVISPFLAKETACKLFSRGRENSEKILVSRKTALGAFSGEDLPQVNCYCMKDEVIDGERSGNLNDAPLHIQQEDIHAKFYLFQQYQSNAPYIYLGSANLTQNGTSSKNVELLVRFKLSRQKIYESICKDLFPQDHNGVFEPYQFTAPVEKSESEKLHDLLEKSYRELSLGKFSAAATNDKDKYQIAITFSGKMPKDCSCQIAPLNGEYQTLASEITFNSQAVENLSDFYRVRLEKDGEKIERLLVIDTLSQLPGLVESREILLEKSCLKKPEDLLEYLSYMLAENAYPIAVSRMVQSGKYGIANQQYNSMSSALYEKMLYWAATDKSRLLEIKGVINHRTSANDELNDILNLCETFYRIAGGDK